jgi:hypothetical protein
VTSFDDQHTPLDDARDRSMHRTYVGVILVWAAVLGALYAFQEIFS